MNCNGHQIVLFADSLGIHNSQLSAEVYLLQGHQHCRLTHHPKCGEGSASDPLHGLLFYRNDKELLFLEKACFPQKNTELQRHLW